jgi:ribosomal protein L20
LCPKNRGQYSVYHGLRRKHLRSYLDEFVFRFNRRRTRHAAFRSLLDIAVALKSTTYNMLIAEFPRSLIEFQRRFPGERACAAYLAQARWPDGFRCPSCGHAKGWELSTKAFTWECAGCDRQTSVTAGTVMHASKLPLTVWFWAAYLMATHSNGIAATGSNGISLLRKCRTHAA